jgi:DNA-binding CsgD family transcriptional regulator
MMNSIPKTRSVNNTLNEPLLASRTGRWVIPGRNREITATGREDWEARTALGRALGIRRDDVVAKLWAAIARVIIENRTEAITLPATEEKDHYMILVRPARERGFAIITRQRVDLSQLAPPAGVLVELFGLTPTEVIVARNIVRGEELSTIAASRGNSTETIRGYVKNILRKTGCTSQKQLSAMLSRLAMLAAKAGEISE